MHYITAAVYVTCQELTTSLPEGNDACIRNEVNFTCTIRGSPNLTVLILSWSSDEYIGRGDGVALQFTSEAISGKSVASTINENVTAILTNNTNVSGVPVLVSELRIVGARQDSTIRCDSALLSGSSTSTRFFVPGTCNNNYITIYMKYFSESVVLCHNASDWLER